MSRRLGEPRFWFPSLDSTMNEAARRAAQGAPEGTLVSADEQTAGRGRWGRSWRSPAGAGLYFSLVLRPRVPPAASLTLTLAVGLAVARGVGEAAAVRCDIRWPNDVMLEEKKLAGVLLESHSEEGRFGSVIVGVGVNVNQASVPEELAGVATSLRLVTGREYDRQAVLEAILRRLEDYYASFLGRGPEAIIEAFSRASSWVRGRRVRVEGAGEELAGVTAGLDPSGMLLIETGQGRLRPVVAGSVRPLE